MARIFATPQQLADYLDPDADPGPAVPPANAQRLLRNASREVSRITLCSEYDTDSGGMPTDADVLAAFVEATCAQAEWLIANGDDAGDGPGGYSEVKVLSITLKRGSKTDSPSGAKASGEDATVILREAGLVPGHPWSWR